MYKGLITYLNKPAPFVESLSKRLLISLFFGLFIFTFLLVFQPFSIAENTDAVVLKCFGYGLITFLIMVINAVFIPILFPKLFDSAVYKVKHNVLLSIWILVLIAILNWVFTSYLFPTEEMISLPKFTIITFAVGLFPIFIGSYYLERKLNNEHKQLAIEVSNTLSAHVKSVSKSQYLFHSDQNNEQLNLRISDLLFIKSEGNYCEFFYQKNGEVDKMLLRTTMKKVKEILAEEVDVIICHRSYLVNLHNIISVSGSARNISLNFDNIEFTVPVSRSNEALVTKAIRQMQ